MKAIKLFLVTLILISGIYKVSGAEVDSLTAKTMARNFYLNMLTQSGWGAKKSTSQDIVLSLIHREQTDLKKAAVQDQQSLSKPLYYIFNVNEDDGFVIVSGDDRIHPVLGYAFMGKYPMNEHVPALEEWMRNYSEQIEYILGKGLKAEETVSQVWEQYLSYAELKGVMAMNEVLPLLSTTWNQGCYYNESCPVDDRGGCGHAYAGCVAVAVAQIMKYWDHPVSSIKIPGYLEPLSYDDDEPIVGTAYDCIPDIEGTVYRWSDMPDWLDPDSRDQEVAAVSELLYHTGVACQMNYGPFGSGAFSWNAQNALISYFHYSPSLHFTSREDYSDENWKLLIQEEIENNRPVYFQGSGTGDHAFVCDGFQDDGYYHFNWGWGGYGDGYFLLSELNPASSDFTKDQHAIVGIEPKSSHTDPYSQLVQIEGCGPNFTQTFQGGGRGSWDLTACYQHSPGKEQVYSFIAPDTGIYVIEVVTAIGSVDYSWRKAVCGVPGWKCINSIEWEGRQGIMSLSGETAYHLLLDDSDTITGMHQFYISYLGRPELSYQGIEIDDDSITSEGNNNGFAEPGETIELRIKLQNSGTADMHNIEGVLSATDSTIIISDSFESFGDINAGEEGTCGADYDIFIPPDFPENGDMPFILELSSLEGEWTIPFSIHVYPHPPPPCDQIFNIEGEGEGYSVVFPGGPRGAWNLEVFGSAAPGKEQVYSFTPADTGMFSFEVLSAEGSVCYGWQPQSCGTSGWINLGIIDTTGSFGPMAWTGGDTYFILMDDMDTTMGNHRYFIDYLGMPDLGYYSHKVDDHNNQGAGADNGVAEPGETVRLILTIHNSGKYGGHDVSVKISTVDPDIKLVNDQVVMGDVESGDTASCEGGFDLSIPVECPGEKDVTIRLDIHSEEGDWEDQFDFYIGTNRTATRAILEEDLFSFFPNPVHDIVYFRLNRYSPCSIELKSLNGQKIFDRMLDAEIGQIDMSSCPPGVYFITVRSKNSVKTKKIIKLEHLYW